MFYLTQSIKIGAYILLNAMFFIFISCSSFYYDLNDPNNRYPPSVTIYSSSNGQEFINPVNIQAGINFDGVDYFDVFLSVDTNPYSSALSYNDEFIYGEIQTLKILPIGKHTISIYAVDSLGKYSTTNTVSFTINPYNKTSIYVSSFGCDTNSGDKNSPLLSVQKASDIACYNDVSNIFLQEGKYTFCKGLSNINNSGVYFTLSVPHISGGWDSNFSSQTGYSFLESSNNNHVIMLKNASNMFLENLWISGGSGGDYGGGIYIAECKNIKISNCVITSNSAYFGGGIYIGGGSGIEIYSEIFENNSIKDGGGIVISGYDRNIIQSCVYNNHSSNGFGGGIADFSDNTTIIESIITNNSGGGILSIDAGTKLINNIVKNNLSDVYNSQIIIRKSLNSYRSSYSDYLVPVSKEVFLSNNIISGNSKSNSYGIMDLRVEYNEYNPVIEYIKDTIINNRFNTNTMTFLYQNFYGVVITNTTEDWNKINDTNWTGTSVSYGNICY